MSTLNPSTRFSNRVDDYVRYRPTYPRELLAVLARRAGLTTASRLADIGGGTGISTGLLLEAGGAALLISPSAPQTPSPPPPVAPRCTA